MTKNANTEAHVDTGRRNVMLGLGAAAGAGAAGSALAAGTAQAQKTMADPYADPENPGLPAVDMEVTPGRTALVVVDPKVDFLSEEGVAWGVVGESVREHNVVDNIEKLFVAAKAADMPVAISPHYYYPQDHKWRFEGTLETDRIKQLRAEHSNTQHT